MSVVRGREAVTKLSLTRHEQRRSQRRRTKEKMFPLMLHHRCDAFLANAACNLANVTRKPPIHTRLQTGGKSCSYKSSSPAPGGKKRRNKRKENKTTRASATACMVFCLPYPFAGPRRLVVCVAHASCNAFPNPKKSYARSQPARAQ